MSADRPARVIDEPFGSRILRLDSPAFRTRYPEIHRKDLIPAAWLPVLERTWRTEEFASRPLDFFALRDVYVTFEGLVFDKYLDVYQSSVTGHFPEEIERSRAAIRDGLARGSIPAHMARAVLCKKRGAVNYGHFLAEMLPRAHLARSKLGDAALHYIVPGPGEVSADVVGACFDMLGIERRRLIPCGRPPVFFKEVIVPDGLTKHGSYMSPLVVPCFDRIAEAVEPGPHERLHVSRRGAKFRKLRNEEALAEVFAEHGYHTVDPVGLPFREQVALFKGARRIVGVCGAGLTNVCFTPPGAALTAFTTGTMPDTFYWFLCTHKRHAFRDVRFPELGGEPPGFASWNGDIEIPPEELARWL